ncbi:MAG: type II secretion system F family protein [Planctomycetaceae bacterium]|nr:type II secretion system F family protein [Planctomycetaceae bacterium]
MQFVYTAKSSSGSTVNGTIDAASVSDARRQLRTQGMFPMACSQATRNATAAIRKKVGGNGKVPKTELMMITSQLAIMTQSGVDFADALKNVKTQCSHPTLRRQLEDIYENVSAGQSVSTALGQHVGTFGPAYVAVVAAGEASGSLMEVLSRLAELLKNEIRLKSSIWSILAYPLVLLIVASLVVSALVLFVLPQFSDVFRDLGTTPPPMTQFLLATSLWVQDHLIWLALFGGLGVVGAWRLCKTEAARLTRDKVMISAPIIKRATKALLTGRVFRLLGTMLETGMPLLEGLQLCRLSVNNTLFQRLFSQLEQDVINGLGIGNGLAASQMVPPSAAQMVQTAEKTGRLGTVMTSVGEFYEEDGERQLRQTIKLLEPLIIVLMGVVVAGVVLSVMLPLLDVSTATG